MSGLVRPARIVFVVAAWLFALSTILMVYLAGLGVFQSRTDFITHRDVGYLIGILPLLMLILALVGRLPRSMMGASAVLVVLMVLQSLFVFMRTDAPLFAALHPVNGFVIAGLAVAVAWVARRHLAAPVVAEALNQVRRRSVPRR